MEWLIQALASIEYWHWLALGLVLLLAELVTGSTYLLWPAVAAWLTGLLAMIIPVPWAVQLVVFSVAVLALLIFARPLFRNRLLMGPLSTVNEPALHLIGTQGMASAAFAQGEGRVRLGDTEWRAESQDAIAAGETVDVIGVEGSSLKVRRRAPTT
jgi:membrane protein implicated in regulation of membrane protease activity